MPQISEQLTETIHFLDHLIGFNSESQLTNLELIEYLKQYFEPLADDMWLSYNRQKTKANLFITIDADSKQPNKQQGTGGILFSGHTDVVPVANQQWSQKPYQMWQQDNRLYGRGSCDMKGFIACCMSAAKYWKAQKNQGKKLLKPLHFAWTYDEEVGCFGAKVLAQACQQKAIIPSQAIVGEPTNMQVVESHKSCFEYATHFSGLAGHGSMPEKGVSAVEYACRYVAKLLDLRQQLIQRTPPTSCFEPPYSSLQVGAIDGGIAHNVIADQCVVEWDFRSVNNADKQFLETSLENYCNDILLPTMHQVYAEASIQLQTIGEVEGLQAMPENQLRDWSCQILNCSQATSVAFATEAGIFQNLGTQTIVCGPGSIEQAHKADEFIAISELEKCLQFLQRFGDALFD